jgi:hypothetical protein
MENQPLKEKAANPQIQRSLDPQNPQVIYVWNTHFAAVRCRYQ